MVSPVRCYETGQFYHVYNRGNRHQPLFLSVRDYSRFLDRFMKLKREHPVTVLAYCLMPNHFHFLVRQEQDGALSKLFGRLATSHAKYINTKYGLDGSLFQRGFQARLIVEEPHLLHLFRYVHENSLDLLPETLRVKPEILLDQIIDYRWSSLAEYLKKDQITRTICDTKLMGEILGTMDESSLRDYLIADIRQYQQEHIMNQIPFGSQVGKS